MKSKFDKGKSKQDRSKEECFYCGKKGHRQNECRKKIADDKAKKGEAAAVEKEAGAVTYDDDSDEEETHEHEEQDEEDMIQGGAAPLHTPAAHKCTKWITDIVHLMCTSTFDQDCCHGHLKGESGQLGQLGQLEQSTSTYMHILKET